MCADSQKLRAWRWTTYRQFHCNSSLSFCHCPEGPCESYNFKIIPGMVNKCLQLPELLEPLFALQIGKFEFVKNNYNSKCALTYGNSRLLLLLGFNIHLSLELKLPPQKKMLCDPKLNTYVQSYHFLMCNF